MFRKEKVLFLFAVFVMTIMLVPVVVFGANVVSAGLGDDPITFQRSGTLEYVPQESGGVKVSISSISQKVDFPIVLSVCQVGSSSWEEKPELRYYDTDRDKEYHFYAEEGKNTESDSEITITATPSRRRFRNQI